MLCYVVVFYLEGTYRVLHSNIKYNVYKYYYYLYLKKFSPSLYY